MLYVNSACSKKNFNILIQSIDNLGIRMFRLNKTKE